MGAHMKTTIEIADALLTEARRVAEQRGVTLRTLVEEGLRHVVKTGKRRPEFRLRDASFTGEGLQPAFDGAPWERVRDAAYEGHGS
jgi:Arc/MetJ family transcription regulator